MNRPNLQTAVTVIQEGKQRPGFKRGNPLEWLVDIEASARHLGRQVGDELCAVEPRLSDVGVIQIAGSLADEERPLIPEHLSPHFFHGVFARLEGRRQVGGAPIAQYTGEKT
jgi:hypothetical protein